MKFSATRPPQTINIQLIYAQWTILLMSWHKTHDKLSFSQRDRIAHRLSSLVHLKLAAVARTAQSASNSGKTLAVHEYSINETLININSHPEIDLIACLRKTAKIYSWWFHLECFEKLYFRYWSQVSSLTSFNCVSLQNMNLHF